MRSTLWIAALCALPLAAQEETEPEVRLELVADTTHATPGARFQVGVRLRMPEHWHVYWENPGESGLPTVVDVTAPEGFRVGRPIFPGPERFDLPGGVVSYGYEEELLVLVPVTAPSDLRPGGTAELSVSARWLVCREGCYLQRGSARLALPTAIRSGDTVPAPANGGLFARWRERLPRPQAELADLVATWSGGDEDPDLTLSVPRATDLEFFPWPEESMELVSRRRAEREGRIEITLSLDARSWDDEPPPGAMRGLLRVTRDEEERYYQVAIPRSPDEGSDSPEETR